MEAITTIAGPVSVLDRADVDTDQIMPKQFLKRVERTGFGQYLFYDWAKEPGWDLPRTQILVTGNNFGCGSSREHAPWGLEDYGFKAIVAPSFADIFASNCTKIGLLAVELSEEALKELLDTVWENPEAEITVDLEGRVVQGPGFEEPFAFDNFARYRLLNGLDDIGLTLTHEDELEEFERTRPGYLPKVL